MRTGRNEHSRRKIAFFIVTAMLLGLVGLKPATNGATSLARGKITLSRTKKTYDMIGLWDKIKLNNVPAGAKISWKSSNPKIVKIKSHITNGIWYKVLKNGKATITAGYKGKKYRCHIKVKEPPEPTKTPKPTATPVEDDDPPVDPTIEKATLNATEVDLHFGSAFIRKYMPDWPDNPDTFQFKVIGTEKKPTWTLKYEGKAGLSISKDGLLSFGNMWVSDGKYEATVICRLGNQKKLTAHVNLINDYKGAYRKKLDEDFYVKYPLTGLTEPEKVSAICKYISNEYDYDRAQYDWETMVITGGGDCMASRIGVYELAQENGMRAWICGKLDDHGMTMVRCRSTDPENAIYYDGTEYYDVYMTVTGASNPRPRWYSVYKMNREGLLNMQKRYPNCLKYLQIEL